MASIDPSWDYFLQHFLNAIITIWFALSAIPFYLGLYALVIRWSVPVSFNSLSNIPLMNSLPWSRISILGGPYWQQNSPKHLADSSASFYVTVNSLTTFKYFIVNTSTLLLPLAVVDRPPTISICTISNGFPILSALAGCSNGVKISCLYLKNLMPFHAFISPVLKLDILKWILLCPYPCLSKSSHPRFYF